MDGSDTRARSQNSLEFSARVEALDENEIWRIIWS